jgi:hypothetical protein
MMLRKISYVLGGFLTGVLAISLANIPRAEGQTPTIDTCRDRIVNEMSSAHDEFRSYVFGSRVDTDGNFTVLTGGQADGERKGILETKERLTSELVPPLVESYRVLRCHSLMVCEVLRQSLGVQGGGVTVRPLGCGERTFERFGECYLAGTPSVGGYANAGSGLDASSLAAYCQQLVEDSLRFERATLQLAVGYDSGYRAMLQLSGMMDWIQADLPAVILQPLRDMMGLLGKLHQIPCFIGQCDYPTDTQDL